MPRTLDRVDETEVTCPSFFTTKHEMHEDWISLIRRTETLLDGSSTPL